MKQKNNQSAESKLVSKKQVLFMLLFVLIAAMSVWAVMSQSQNFSLSDFGDYIQHASLSWMIIAVVSMLGFIIFEGVALQILCRAFGFRCNFRQGFIYSASDIYFSAITPSASGGQPASAYFMMKDGIDGMMTTVILVANLVMYTAAIIVIGILCFVFRFDLFLKYSLPAQILIIVGCILQIGLLIFFYLLLKKDRLLQKMCNCILRLLCWLHILRNREKLQKKLDAYMDKYRQYSQLLSGHRNTLFFCFLFNLLQRASQIAVTMFVFAATTGKSFLESLDLWFWQGYVVLGSNCMPIPGAVGISDYLMLDGFKNIMTESEAVNLELLSRSFSFYSCVIICGIAVVAQYFVNKRRVKRT